MLAASAALTVSLLAAAPNATATPAGPPSDPAAVEVLAATCQFLGRQERFAFRASSSHEVQQKDGRKLEFDTERSYNVRRPDRVWLTAERDGTRWELWYDGKTVTIVDHSEDAYSTVPAPATMDGMLTFVVEDLGIPLPLHALLFSDPCRAVRLSEASVTHCGTRLVAGATCHHVSLRLPELDAQMWIEVGDRPVPRKLVLRYRNLPGAPEFRAVLSDWNFSPPPLEGLVTLSPPKDAHPVEMLILKSKATAPTAQGARP